ncbi:MAG TPA: ISL3 family transposase [Gemmataceae bacterium]|nr:ISL3 family transposase [Gemmataceae bacterium]
MTSLVAELGLLPANSELEIEHIVVAPESATLVVRATSATAACPTCGHPSQRVHSRYQRKLADLPWQGRTVAVRLQARRFFCSTASCAQKIFVERLPQVAKLYARSTLRLSQTHSRIGMALGGEAGSRLARNLAMPTSADTLLRRVKQYPVPQAPLPQIVGIDEWAWRKGKRYGTILVDLERSKVVDLLPDHESQTLQSWLKQHPQIEIISRDRSGTIAQAASAAAPQAKQVADRWHLLKNLRESAERVFQRYAGGIKDVLAKLLPAPADTPLSPTDENEADASPLESEEAPLSQRQQAQQTRRAHRVKRFEQVRQMHEEGHAIQRIAQIMGMSRETVRRYVREERCPNWHSGRSTPVRLDGFRAAVDLRLQEGCRNAAELHRELTRQGHQVSYHAVRRFVRRRLLLLGKPRQADQNQNAKPSPPSARALAFSLIRRPEERDSAEQNQLQAIRGFSAELSQVLDLTDEFAAMTRKSLKQPLADWLHKAERSPSAEMRGFARSLRHDEVAVAAGLNEKWSNGPVEGANNRLKAIKRQMYGRAGFHLLRARVLNAA